MLKGKKVLVTGAAGFIGSHLVEALLEEGAQVRAFVKYNGRGDWGMLADLPPESLQRVEVVAGNICDPVFVRGAVKDCEWVFHLAALIGIPYSYAAPLDYVQVNIQGTVNVLQACRELHTPHVVHTSTSETYGTAQYVPIDEAHPLQGQSPYSASKIGADKLAEAYHKSFDVPVVTVRPFNTFGPRQSARAFIPTVVSQALTRDRVVLGALDPVRDLTYVKDTARGFIAAGGCADVVGQVVNLGTGQGHSMREVAELILQLMGRSDLPIEQDAGRVRPDKSEVQRLICNPAVARDRCGWSARYSLAQGLEPTIAWIKKNLHRFRPDRYTV
ncbi:MAG: SDR family NAD(P)-dependent oxidoreductase [Sedimentisphaerales bacterium]|nr:SDR family NAD(P)-dependent oxidoreductase [Sedimentisphaerales bacterium]